MSPTRTAVVHVLPTVYTQRMNSTDSTAPAESVDLDDLRAQRDELDRELGALSMAGRELEERYRDACGRAYSRTLTLWAALDRTITQAERDEQAAGR